MTQRPELDCPKCGRTFECGVAADESPCWCFSKPRVEKLPREFEDCLCPACLEEILRQAKTRE